MTPRDEAIEAVARAICAERVDHFVSDRVRRGELTKCRGIAAALVDHITPLLTRAADARLREAVDAERERCAVICETKEAAHNSRIGYVMLDRVDYLGSHPGMAYAATIRAGKGVE